MGYQKRLTISIIELLPSLPNAAIGREVGCSREYVRLVRKEYKIPVPVRLNEVNIIQKTIEMAKKGIQVQEIAEHLDVKFASLRYILTKNNIKLRGFCLQKRYIPRRAGGLEFIKNRSGGGSMLSFAKKNNIPYATVQRWGKALQNSTFKV